MTDREIAARLHDAMVAGGIDVEHPYAVAAGYDNRRRYFWARWSVNPVGGWSPGPEVKHWLFRAKRKAFVSNEAAHISGFVKLCQSEPGVHRSDDGKIPAREWVPA